MRKIDKRGTQKGIALLTVLLLLILLSALGVGLMFMTNTETQINFNFRQEQSAYFAARSGLEEIRDRILTTNPNTNIAGYLPLNVPTTAGANVFYIINPGAVGGSAINPWDPGRSNHRRSHGARQPGAGRRRTAGPSPQLPQFSRIGSFAGRRGEPRKR